MTILPSNLLSLFTSLNGNQNFRVLASILRTKSSDFIPTYCNLWRKSDDSEMISRIWEAFKRKEIDLRDLDELLVPECITKSAITLINLTDRMIRIIPQSLLQVKDIPVHLLQGGGSVLEIILKKAVLINRPHDPRIKWFNWISSEDFDFSTSFTTPFYAKYGWQLVDPESFPKLPKIKSECLLSWICDDEGKLTNEEILLRSLTLASWKSDKGIKKFSSAIKSQKQSGNLIFRILYNNEFTLDLLFEVIDTMNMILKNDDIVVIGDWFIGILHLWEKHLKNLKTNQYETRKLIDFVMFDLNPSFQGIIKFTDLFDPKIRPLIEVNAVEMFHETPYLKYFYHEYPKYFQLSKAFKKIPLRHRWSCFLRKKRTFTTSEKPFLLQTKCNVIFLHGQEKFFLIKISETFLRGVEELGTFSLNPTPMTFKRIHLSFKCFVEMFLQSVKTMKHWFSRVAGGGMTIKPQCPEYFWESIGYFLIQARILKAPIPFLLNKKFFLEMLRENQSDLYIEKLSKPFKKCPFKQCAILESNLLERFSIASLLNYDHENINDVPLVNCKKSAMILIQKGMAAMRKGINYILDPFKFDGEELYSIIFNK